jgi:TolB-like protein
MSCLLLVLIGQGAFTPVQADDYGKLASELTKAAVRHGKRRVAVLPFRVVGTGGNAGTFVAEKLTGPLLASDQIEVVERAMLETVLREQRLQASGATDSRSIKELGKVLGVDAIVTGTILALKNDRVELNARLIDAETARVLSAPSAQVEKEWDESVAATVFDVQVPPLGNMETPDMKDSLNGDDTNCLSARSRATQIDESLVDLKAKYWAARLRSPGFSRASLKQNPGSEIENPGVKAEFMEKLKRYYQEAPAAITDQDLQQLNDGQRRIDRIGELCHGA